MAGKNISHFLDEKNKMTTAGFILLQSLWVLVLGVALLRAPETVNSIARKVTGTEILSSILLALAMGRIVISILIPFFKFEKYPSFESLS